MKDNVDGIEASEKIAIIGMAGRFPAARNVAQFWRLLAEERMGTRWLTDEELLAEGVTQKELADPEYVRAVNCLPDMECFDAGFFGFSPREASILDPQHRHFLECSWEALEDAGHMPEHFDGRVGVFAGSGMQAYLPFNLLTNPDLVEEIGMFLLRHTGNDKDFLTTRLSYLLNLQGPSVAIQTACSTSLVAVHQAAASLLSMECDMAIAGGVTVELPHRHGYKFAGGEILSPDGKCRAFDNDSQGTVFGSGAAVVVLRRLEDALADGDDIRAVLLGSAVNNDGAQKAGYLAPSVDGQAEAAAEALAIAGVAPETVTYIEAHGTGTPVGDPIELAALSQVYGAGGSGFCGIGSVKTNVGHLDTAAGAVSLIKVIESLRHEKIPASLHYKTPNTRFDIAASPFYVVDKSTDWKRGDTPRRAAVNSLGVGGTNAHAIIEEAPYRPTKPQSDVWRILPFSARTPASLDGLKLKWREFLANENELEIADAAYTLSYGRREFDERMVVIAKDMASAIQAFSNPKLARIAKGTAPKGNPDVVFMFPGGGAQYPGAGAGLLDSSQVFRQAVDECFAKMPTDAPADLHIMMFEREFADQEARAKLEKSGYAIPALFILEYAYSKMWLGWGVTPAAVFGHSAGEYAAAVIAGVMSVEDALKIVTWRGKVMDAADAGAMSVIPATRDKVHELVGDSLDIAALNAPDLCVVSGGVEDIDALESRLAGTEFEATRIRINVAAHSRILDNQLDNFRDGIDDVSLSAPEIPFVSSLRGDWSEEGDFSTVEYWVQHLRHTGLFADAVETILKKPNQIILEVGPGQTLGPLALMSDAENRPQAVLASGRQPKDVHDDMAFALTTAGAIWANGGRLDWDALPGTSDGRRVSLPTYAFEKKRHWIEPGRGLGSEGQTATEVPLFERKPSIDDWYETIQWVEAPLPPVDAVRDHSWLVFHGNDPVSEILIEELNSRNCSVFTVRPGDAFKQSGTEFQIRVDSEEDYDALFAALPSMPTHISHHWSVLPREDKSDQTHLFDSAFCLCRAIQAADVTTDIHLSFAGFGAVSVSGEDVECPELGTLLGPVRVAPREVPSLRAQYIDLDMLKFPEWAAKRILEEHDASAQEDRVVYRLGMRLKESIGSLDVSLADDVPVKLKMEGCYVITGGTGGIGLALARYLGTTIKAHVALIARTTIPKKPEWPEILKSNPNSKIADYIRVVEEIRNAGGKVTAINADVTDENALTKALSKIRTKFGDIDGVFHGAGAIDDAPMMMKSLEDAHRVMAAKVNGTALLSRLLPVGEIDFFAAFSSTSVITAPPGQIDYVAANSYLEAVMASRTDGVSISWGVWRDIGMASEAYGLKKDTYQPVHPLLGEKSMGKDGTITFTAHYDPTDLWVLNEHVVGGVPVLPGTAYIEIARAAMENISIDRSWEIHSLSLESPMAFPEGLQARVIVSLTPEDSGFAFRVESAGAADGPLTEHCRASIKLKRLMDRKLPKELRYQSMLTETGKSGQAQDELIEFGPRWDNVGAIRTGIDIVEADFVLSEEFLDDLLVYAAHPGLTDEAATIGLNLLDDVGTQGAFYAPMSVDRIRILGPLPKNLVARAKIVAQTPGRFTSFDVVIMDSLMTPLMILEGFALRRVEGNSFDQSKTPEQLVDRLMAQGIRASEAPDIFDRVLNTTARQMIVSPTSPVEIRREMTQSAEPPRKKALIENDTIQTADGQYANFVEQKIAEFWQDLLGVDHLLPDDDFFDLGGHSLAAVRLFAKIRKEFNTDLPLATLFQAPTLRSLAEIVVLEGGIEIGQQESGMEPATPQQQAKEWTPLVQIKPGTDKYPPLYLVHGAGGNVLNFRSLSGYLDPKLPFYGLRAKGSDGGGEVDETIEEMAASYIAAIRQLQPEGPYTLAGYSGGGVIAYEMASQLVAAGEEINHLIMFDTLAPEVDTKPLSLFQKIWMARHWSLRFALGWPLRKWQSLKSSGETKQIRQHLENGERIPDELIGRRMTQAYLAAESRYRPPQYSGDVLLFLASEKSIDFLRAGPHLGWDEWVTGQIALQSFDCDHFNMMVEPTIADISEVINEMLIDG